MPLTYDLSSGLDVTQEIIGSSVSHNYHIDGAAFEPLDKEGATFKTTQAAVHHPLKLTKDSQTLFAVATGPEDSKDISIFAMAWGSNFEHPIGESMVACVSDCLPKQRVISWNGFGRGNSNVSSKINPKAIKHARRTGSFTEVGREYAKHIAPLLKKDKNIHLLGVSEGARIVLAMAPFLGRKVKDVVLFDAPGTLDVSYRQYFKKFMSERPHSDAYVDASPDQQMNEFLGKHNNVTFRSMGIFKDIRRGILLDHYYRSPRAMARNALSRDLELAAPHISGKLAFIYPHSSAVNLKGGVHAGLSSAAKINPNMSTELWSFNGSHAFINAGTMAQAALLAYVLNHH